MLVPRTAKTRRAARLRVELLEDRAQPAGGALDPTFGTGGLVQTDVGSTNDAARDAALQPDGKIVVVGNTQTKAGTILAVARYLPGGALDAGFGSGGKVKSDILKQGGEHARAVALQPDGKIVVVCTATVGQSRTTPTVYDNALLVVRYNPNGTLDTTFNRTGSLLINPSSGPDEARAVAVQPDGKILVGGTVASPGAATWQDFFLARVTAAGGLDSTFGTGGTVATDFTEFNTRPTPHVSNDSAHQIRVQPDGRILVAGGLDLGFALARYNPNGSLDPTFGTGGKASVPVGFGVDFDRIYLGYSQEKLVLGGTLWNYLEGHHDLAVARTDAAGNSDPTFGGTGWVAYGRGYEAATETRYDERIGGLVVQPDGTVTVAGYRHTSQNSVQTSKSVLLVRFSGQGVPDPSFGSGGEVITSISTNRSGDGAAALIQLPDGKLLVAGTTYRTAGTGSDGDFLLARYLPSAPQVGSFTASANSVPVGSPVTLTAADVQALNPGSTITQVAFYRDANGDGLLQSGTDTFLGFGTQTSPGTWTFTFTFAASGPYKLFAQAEDSYGVLSDPLSLDCEVL